MFPGDYNLLYDNGKPIRLIGKSSLNERVEGFLKNDRDIEIVTLEEVVEKGEWFADNFQFMANLSDVKFKQTLITELTKFDLNFISVIGTSALLHPTTKIGRNTVISNFNNISGANINIGNHVYISPFCSLSENSHIGDYSYISPYCYVKRCDLGQGSILGVRTSIIGDYDDGEITIAPYTNLITNSTVTKNIDTAGTYYSNRLLDTGNSLEKRIL